MQMLEISIKVGHQIKQKMETVTRSPWNGALITRTITSNDIHDGYNSDPVIKVFKSGDFIVTIREYQPDGFKYLEFSFGNHRWLFNTHMDIIEREKYFENRVNITNNDIMELLETHTEGKEININKYLETRVGGTIASTPLSPHMTITTPTTFISPTQEIHIIFSLYECLQPEVAEDVVLKFIPLHSV